MHVVKTEGGWAQLHKKSGSRFVFVSFGAVSHHQSQAPAPLLRFHVAQSELRHVAAHLLP